MTPFINDFSPMVPGMFFLFLVLVGWSLLWKAIALWKAARNDDKIWYVLLLVVNTAGILEIIYIYFFSKKGQETQKTQETPKTPKTAAPQQPSV